MEGTEPTAEAYEPPALIEIGKLTELTLAVCNGHGKGHGYGLCGELGPISITSA